MVLKFDSAGSEGMSTQAPRDVELPAVVDAANAVFFVAAEEDRGATMGAGFGDEPGTAAGVPEGDEVFAEQADAHGLAVRLQLPGVEEGKPVGAHDGAHLGAWADATHDLVVCCAEHVSLLRYAGWRIADDASALNGNTSGGDCLDRAV